MLALALLSGLVAAAGCATSASDRAAVPIQAVTPPPTAIALPATTAVPTAAALPTATAQPASTATPTVDATTPTSVPGMQCGPASSDQRLDVINVASDDADGGLVVHSEPGASTPIVGVLPAHARGITFQGQCETVADGGTWWFVWSPATTGWVNSFYLGQRAGGGESFDEQACRSGDPDVDLSALPERHEALDQPVVSDVRVVSTAACDRVIFEFADRWDFRKHAEPVTLFTQDLLGDMPEIERSGGELTVRLGESIVNVFESNPPNQAWRDVATEEQNVALAFDRDESIFAYVGFGNGQASVHIADNPARLIIDIVQHASSRAELVGPIAAADGHLTLFEPLQSERTGPGVTGPVRVRGWSRGFEATSLIEIRPWSGGAGNHPSSWDGPVFGPDAERIIAEPARRTARNDLVSELELPIDHFTTSGYFDFEIELVPGAYQLTISPSSGIGCGPIVGQQFRVAEPGGDPNGRHPSAVPFSVDYQFIDLPGKTEESDRMVRRTVDVEGKASRVERPCS